MAIRKRGEAWQIDYLDPNGKRVRKSFKKKKDAVAEYGKRVSLIAEGRYLDVKKDYKTTIGELVKKYDKNYQDQTHYLNAKKTYLERFVDNFGADAVVARIQYMDVETYCTDIKRRLTPSKKARSASALNREVAALHHLFVKGVEWQIIESNPFDAGKSLLVKENNSRIRYLEKEQIGALLNECPAHLKDIVVCAVNTGMRRGEILSLKWDQIRNGFIYLTKTKTNEPRQIPINNDLDALFKSIRRDNQLKSPYVFLYGGRRITDIGKGFKAALRRAGIDNFRFHDLRHTFASALIMNGATLKDVQELLGHKNMTMTLRYAHLSQKHKKDAVNLLNGITSGQCHKSVTKPKLVNCASV